MTSSGALPLCFQGRLRPGGDVATCRVLPSFRASKGWPTSTPNRVASGAHSPTALAGSPWTAATRASTSEAARVDASHWVSHRWDRLPHRGEGKRRQGGLRDCSYPRRSTSLRHSAHLPRAHAAVGPVALALQTGGLHCASSAHRGRRGSCAGRCRGGASSARWRWGRGRCRRLRGGEQFVVAPALRDTLVVLVVHGSAPSRGLGLDGCGWGRRPPSWGLGGVAVVAAGVGVAADTMRRGRMRPGSWMSRAWCAHAVPVGVASGLRSTTGIWWWRWRR